MANKKNIEAKIKKLLDLLDINFSHTIKVIEEEGVININIQTEETGILIGFHGETLQSLQTILSLIIYKELGEWQKVNLNIGDYLEKREEKLKQIADSAVEEVMATNKSITLPYFTPKERRIIHLYLENKQGVKTESIGEDEERRIVVFPQA